jgi:hypothetical protein
MTDLHEEGLYCYLPDVFADVLPSRLECEILEDRQ